MKILHYSDYPDQNFLNLYRQCDVLVTTGDLTSAAFAGLELEPIRKPSFGVYGNHDAGSYLADFRFENLHNHTVAAMDFVWGGWDGALRYKSGEFMYTEQEAEAFVKTFPYVDILLLHAGPASMLDDPSDANHRGSPALAEYVKTKKPRYVFVGHQYSSAQMSVGPTRIFRTFGARIIEI